MHRARPKSSFYRWPSCAALLVPVLFGSCACAQQEIPPPQGKGHVVVLLSGIKGLKHDRALAEAIAALGYDVYFCDGRKMERSQGEAIREAIRQAQQLPHALPGKAALMGVSLGGGFALFFGSHWPDLVATDIVWYPATGFAKRIPGFANSITVPTLMFAGEADDYHKCCMIETARTLAADAGVAGAPFELVAYPGVNHDFIKGGAGYDEHAYNDALSRTAARLKAAFGE